MGPKGKRLTKAELERQKQEEAERRAREEEEERLRLEAEAEQEAIEAEEQRLRSLSFERLRAKFCLEDEDLSELVCRVDADLDARRRAMREKRKWDRYTLCDGRPNPLDIAEINTYMNLLRSSDDGLAEVLKHSELVMELIEDVRDTIREHYEDALREEDALKDEDGKGNQIIGNLNDTLESLRLFIFDRIDRATFKLLRAPGAAINPDSLNIEHTSKTDDISCSVWGNAGKNPRVKSVEFSTLGFLMDLTKNLLLSDLAVRMLVTKFDQYSLQCSTYSVKAKKPKVNGDPPKSSLENPSSYQLNSQSSTLGSVNTTDSNADSPQAEPYTAPIENEPETSQTNMNSSRQAVDSNEFCESEGWVNQEEEEEEEVLPEDVVDLRNFMIIGPIVHIQMFSLPPQSSKIGNWVVQKKAESEELTKFSNEAALTQAKDTFLSIPLSIYMNIPSDVMVFESLNIAKWDADEKHWKLGQVDDFAYNLHQNNFTFNIKSFGQFALIQDAYINMPFNSFRLLPTGRNQCEIAISAAYINLTFKIKEDACCLAPIEGNKQLAHLFDKWMTPVQMQELLRPTGVSVFPQPDGHKYVSVMDKDPDAVKAIYQHMAVCAPAFAFSWSKWNNAQAEEGCRNNVVVQAAEQPLLQKKGEAESPPGVDPNYRLYIVVARLAYQLGMAESSEEFREEMAEGAAKHSNLYHALMEGCSEDAKKTCRGASASFTNTVRQFLEATNLLVFS